MYTYALYRKWLLGIILFIAVGALFTNSANSQEQPINVTPLSTISTFDLPKEPPLGLNNVERPTTTASNGSDNDNTIPIPIPEADITFDKECTPTNISMNQEMLCTITATNNSSEDYDYKILDLMLPNVSIREDSVEGGELFGRHVIISRGTLAAGTLPSLTISNTNKPIAYNSLSEFGIPAFENVQDESVINLSTLNPYIFNGIEYTTVGMTSNGYLIAGLGSDEDISYIPQVFPNEIIPNNVIAPFWTDLNPEAGGNLYAALLTRDEKSWAVLEWEDVPVFDSDKLAPNCTGECSNQFTFQVWIETNAPAQDITFIYEKVGGPGAQTGLGVGAENADGSLGDNYASVPTVEDQLSIIDIPGTDGESHTISYTAEPIRSGPWFGCALMKIFGVRGINYDCLYGSITE